MRIFRGGNEIIPSKATLTRSNDTVTDTAKVSIQKDANVTIGTVLDFKKADGSTTVFSAKVFGRVQSMLWHLTLKTNGYELLTLKKEAVFTNATPEAIVEDCVDDTTNLTYASTVTSGVTISKYIADDYLINIIADMMFILQWPFWLDESDNAYFEPEGYTDNGHVFTNGSGFQITEWKDDWDSAVNFNKVKVRGAKITRRTQKVFSQVGTTFTLDEKPVGTVKVIISGSELEMTSPTEPYTVDTENKQVIFTSSRTDPTIEYSFAIPIVLEGQNDQSISDYGMVVEKKIEAPWLKTFADARRYIQNLLDVFSTPLISAKGFQGELDFTRQINEMVTVYDPIRNLSEKLAITKIVLDIKKNRTDYEFGKADYVMGDWQREVQDRILKLERRTVDESELGISRVFKHDVKVSLALTQVFEKNSPVDSFIRGHTTLGRRRPDLNMEADCSDNSHNGTWTGTGIAGSQYDTSGWRLSAGQFNGSDRIITVSDDSDLDLAGSNFTIVCAVQVASLPGAVTPLFGKYDGTDGWLVRINASNKIELIYSNSGSDSTITADTALTANVFQHLIFVKEGTDLTVYVDGTSDNTDTGDANAGTNAEDLYVGKNGADFFTGHLDEIMLYNTNKSSSEVTSIYGKIEDSTNMKLYLSMDNPRRGDRQDARVTVT